MNSITKNIFVYLQLITITLHFSTCFILYGNNYGANKENDYQVISKSILTDNLINYRDNNKTNDERIKLSSVGNLFIQCAGIKTNPLICFRVFCETCLPKQPIHSYLITADLKSPPFSIL